jgi:hypothetical protein
VSVPLYPTPNVLVGPNQQYTRLYDALTDNDQDITGQGPFVICIREPFTDTQNIQFSIGALNSWKTTQTDYIHIYVHPDARHGGYWDNSKYNLSAGSYFGTFFPYGQDIVLDGLQIKNTFGYGDTGGPACGIYAQFSGSSIVRNCIFDSVTNHRGLEPTMNSNQGILIHDIYPAVPGTFPSDYKWSAIIENNIISGYRVGIQVGSFQSVATASVTIQHNTIVNQYTSGSTRTAVGIQDNTYPSGSDGLVEIFTRNNLVYTSPTISASYTEVAGAHIAYNKSAGRVPSTSDMTHNVSYADEDQHTAWTNQIGGTRKHFTDLDPNFVDIEGKDFRLSPGNNEHIRVGKNLRDDPYFPIWRDINGVSRDDGKPGAYAGAHHPQEKGFREFPVDETRMERKYRGRR